MKNKNEYIFYIPQQKVNLYAHRLFLSHIDRAIRGGFKNIRIDFSRVLYAYPNGMIPIISTIDYYKRNGITFNICFIFIFL